MNTETAPVLDIEVYHHNGDECHVRIAGILASVDAEFSPAAPECGDGAYWDATLQDCTAILVDRAEWDAACPGVEPTPEAIKALLDQHRRKIEEDAAEIVADFRAGDCNEPDDDGECYFDAGDC